jgi:hypothetical protein
MERLNALTNALVFSGIVHQAFNISADSAGTFVQNSILWIVVKEASQVHLEGRSEDNTKDDLHIGALLAAFHRR